jgi:hypothetical protein
MTLSTFPTFLSFLTQALCFPPASDPRRALEVPPYLRRKRLGPPTVWPEASDLTGRPESASEVAMASAGASRLGAAITPSISAGKGYYLSDFDDAFRRYLGQKGGLDPSHRHNADEMGTSEGFSSVTPEPSVTDGKREESNNEQHCDGVTDADPGFACTANGNGAGDHRCDHCGQLGASGHWDWLGWPDGIWLHPRCEAPWVDNEGGARM